MVKWSVFWKVGEEEEEEEEEGEEEGEEGEEVSVSGRQYQEEADHLWKIS